MIAVVCGLAGAAGASPWPEPERPVSHPDFVSVDVAGYTGLGLDTRPDTSGLGVRASALAGSARPLWLWARGSYLVPLDDGPQGVLGELLIGRSLWRCDCAMYQDGELVIQTPVRAMDPQGNPAIRSWAARRPATAARTLPLHADLVLAAGARMLTSIGDNPGGSHTGVILVPQAGLWFHQQFLYEGHRGRVRLALLGAYESYAESWGAFVQVEAALAHVHIAVDAGTMSNDWGARELTLSLGYEL